MIPVFPFSLRTPSRVPFEYSLLLRPRPVEFTDIPNVQVWMSILLCCYARALVVASPLCGWLVDRSSSRQVPFLLGQVAMAASIILLCVATSPGLLAVGRLMEGLSAAVKWTSGIAMVIDAASESEIGEIVGHCSLSMTLGTLLGPPLAGVVFARGGYLVVFAVVFAVVVVDTMLRVAIVEKKAAGQTAGGHPGGRGEQLLDNGVRQLRSAEYCVDTEISLSCTH